MSYQKSVTLLSILFTVVIIAGCSLHPNIKPDESYMRIKPVAPLSDYEQSQMPDNFEVVIENVADMAGSYKNRIEFYVNKYRIEPDEIYNYKSSYKYSLKLQPGQYKVQAKYYAHSGWQEQSFTIKTRENVKVYPDKKAQLSITLQKNHWGGLKDKENYFKIDYQALTK